MAHWVKCWPAKLLVWDSIQLDVKFFPSVNRVQCTKPFIIAVLSTPYNGHTFERAVKLQVSHPFDVKESQILAVLQTY